MAIIQRIDDTTAKFSEGTLTGVQAVNDDLKLAYKPALSFDGVDDGVTFTSAPTTILDNITGEAIVKISDVSSIQRIFYLGDSGSNGWGLYLISGKITGLCGGVGYAYSDYFPSVNEILKIRLARVNGVWHIWVNEIERTVTGNPIPKATSNYFGISNYDYFNGSTMDVRIWETVNTTYSLTSILTGNEPGLVAYYKFDEGTGTTLTDYAGTNNGTITGATWTTSPFYIDTGNRITPNIDLTQYPAIKSSNIQWTETLNSQSIVIEARTSTDGGNTWSDWQSCTNNGSIPGIQPNSLLQIRQTLSTTNITTTPVLDSLNITIKTEEYIISGRVTENGSPVQRKIRVYLRSDGHLVYETISTPDGTFIAYTDTQGEHYVVALDDITDENNYNALIYDRIIPGAM